MFVIHTIVPALNKVKTIDYIVINIISIIYKTKADALWCIENCFINEPFMSELPFGVHCTDFHTYMNGSNIMQEVESGWDLDNFLLQFSSATNI